MKSSSDPSTLPGQVLDFRLGRTYTDARARNMDKDDTEIRVGRIKSFG
jgi:hypothetical protein